MAEYVFDAWAGWSEDRLKARLLELCVASMQKDIIIMLLVDGGKDSLSMDLQEKVMRIQASYAEHSQ